MKIVSNCKRGNIIQNKIAKTNDWNKFDILSVIGSHKIDFIKLYKHYSVVSFYKTNRRVGLLIKNYSGKNQYRARHTYGFIELSFCEIVSLHSQLLKFLRL